MAFFPASITLQGKLRVSQPPDQAFSLFSPRGEEAWAPDWKPEILYPAGAEWEAGLVFRTIRGGQEAIWFVGSLDRAMHRVTYYRVDIGIVAVTISITCEAVPDEVTEAGVRYTFVGLSEAGNQFVRSRNQDDFAAWMNEWEASIAACCAR